MQHIPEDSEKVEDLLYQLEGTVAEEHRVQKTVESLRRYLDTVRGTINSYSRGFPNITERVRTNVTDRSGGFVSEFVKEARKVTKNQRNTNKLAVMKELEDVNAFLRSLQSKASRPGPFLASLKLNELHFVFVFRPFLGLFVWLGLLFFLGFYIYSPFLVKKRSRRESLVDSLAALDCQYAVANCAGRFDSGSYVPSLASYRYHRAGYNDLLEIFLFSALLAIKCSKWCG